MAALEATADGERRGGDELAGLDDEAQALELVQGACAGVGGRVGDETQFQLRVPQAPDRLNRARDRLVLDVQDAIEVEKQCADIRQHGLKAGATSAS